MSRPKCPNHTVEMDKTDNRRMWICPISGAIFQAEVDDQENTLKRDKFGGLIHEIKVTQADGGTGG